MTIESLPKSARAVIAAAAASSLLLLSGCQLMQLSGQDPEPTAEETQATDDDYGTDETEAPTETEDAAPAAEMKQIPVGHTIKDDAVGDTIEIVSVVRDFPAPSQDYRIKDGGEVLLVEVKVTPSGQYSGRVSPTDFSVAVGGSSPKKPTTLPSLKDEMSAAGFTMFEGVSRRDGAGEGYLAIQIDTRQDTYEMEYNRSAAKIIGQDTTIDAFKDSFKLPNK